MMNNKLVYVPPITISTKIEAERIFLNGSVIGPGKNDKVETSGHEVGNTFNASSWENSSWN